MIRRIVAGIIMLGIVPLAAAAQAPGRWPPDSLINVQVISRTTPMLQVVAMMRNFAGDLGVRCEHCHLGEAGMPLAQFDFSSDERPAKRVARQMMRMVEEVNRRLDTLPARSAATSVTCRTCHRGVAHPMPLSTVIVNAVEGGGLDSAVRAYRALRARHFGRDAYDFSEVSLNRAGLELAAVRRFPEALALLALNAEQFPGSASVLVARGNVQLRRGDTTAAIAAFREALRLDSTNVDARNRLRDAAGRAAEAGPPRQSGPFRWTGQGKTRGASSRAAAVMMGTITILSTAPARSMSPSARRPLA